MTEGKMFRWKMRGAAILGLALCVPAAMLAQNGAAPPPPPDNSGMGAQQGAPPPPPPPGAMQGRHHRMPSPKKQLKRLTRRLNLTPDQQQQILPILQDQHRKMKGIWNDSSLSPQQRREQMRTAMMDTHQKVNAILTPEQRQQMKQMMQQRRDRMRQRRMDQGAPPSPDGAGAPPPPGGTGTPPPPPPQ